MTPGLKEAEAELTASRAEVEKLRNMLTVCHDPNAVAERDALKERIAAYDIELRGLRVKFLEAGTERERQTIRAEEAEAHVAELEQRVDGYSAMCAEQEELAAKSEAEYTAECLAHAAAVAERDEWKTKAMKADESCSWAEKRWTDAEADLKVTKDLLDQARQIIASGTGERQELKEAFERAEQVHERHLDSLKAELATEHAARGDDIRSANAEIDRLKAGFDASMAGVLGRTDALGAQAAHREAALKAELDKAISWLDRCSWARSVIDLDAGPLEVQLATALAAAESRGEPSPAPRDAEREALLAFGEKVREACLVLVDCNDGGREYVMSDIRAIDLAALLPVKP